MDFLSIEMLVVIAVAAIVGFWTGWHGRGIAFIASLSNDPDRTIEMCNQIKAINAEELLDTPDDAIEVKTEQVNGLFYAYNKVTGEFLAQAQNLHQVMVLAASRYPGKKFWHPELTKDSQTA
jgi:hypothetical protein